MKKMGLESEHYSNEFIIRDSQKNQLIASGKWIQRDNNDELSLFSEIIG